MFIPAFIEKEKKHQENRIQIPIYTEKDLQYYKQPEKDQKKETVIHIQIY